MKPLLNLDEPVQRRSGEPARIIWRDALGDYPVIALWQHHAGREQIPESYTLHGSFATDGEDSEHDLINVPKKPKVFTGSHWIAITHDGYPITLAQRPQYSHSFRGIKEVPFSIVEGEGV